MPFLKLEIPLADKVVTVWESKLSFALLVASLPVTFVDSAIRVCVLSIAMYLIVFEVSLV